jgi:hypothetical protein
LTVRLRVVFFRRAPPADAFLRVADFLRAAMTRPSLAKF